MGARHNTVATDRGLETLRQTCTPQLLGKLNPDERQKKASRQSVTMCCRLQGLAGETKRLRTLGEVETMPVERRPWFQLSRVERRTLPAAALLYDTDDELDFRDRESAQLVTALVL